jgi:hypothetical protein
MTKSGKWIKALKVFLPSEYKPDENVERLVKAGF